LIRILKLTGIFLVAVIVIFAGVGLLLPSEFSGTVEKSVNAPADKMCELLATPRTWVSWSPWNPIAMPDMKSSYSGPETGVDAKWSWVQEQSNGSLIVTKYEAAKKMSYTLAFEGFSDPIKGSIELSGNGDTTLVAWSYSGNMGANLLFRWIMLFTDDSMESEYHKAIDGLAKGAGSS
jgi:hypothetical protein